MESFFQDLRFGLKVLWKSKTFTITALLTLAVCIGANSAIFSVINTVLLRPLDLDEPGRMVTLFNSYPNAVAGDGGSNSSGDYFFRREGLEALDELALFQYWGHTVGEEGSPERMRSMRVTPSFLPLLRIDPVLGRGFTEDEMDIGNEQKVLLTYGLWQERFAGLADILGEDFRINGRPYTIVGVLPEEFNFLGVVPFRFLVPTPMPEQARGLDSLHSNNYQMIARLAPGATIEQVVSQLEALNASLTERSPIPNAAQLLADAGFHTQVHDLQGYLLRNIRPTLMILWAGVLFVLLIGCVNIANLMVARSHVRIRELATRHALGAGRSRLTRQLITESVSLAVLGGAMGLGVGSLGLRLLAVLGADTLPRGTEISLDGSAMLFTLILAVGAGLLFGSIPLLNLFRTDLNLVFRQESRTGTAGRGAMMLRSGLAVLQVAIAFMLLISAGLMFVSFRSVLAVDPGFRHESVLTGYVGLPGSKYPDDDSRGLFFDRLLDEIRATPGVAAASVATQLPLGGGGSDSVIMPKGYATEAGESLISPYYTLVGTGYFKTMGIPLIEGRLLEESDRDGSEQVVIIDETLARRYWPDSSPIGKQMLRGVPGMENEEANTFTVVGVVGPVKQRSLDEERNVGAYYTSYRQMSVSFVNVVVKSAVEPTSLMEPIRRLVAGLDPDLPFFGAQTIEEMIRGTMQARRSTMLLLVIFAGVALFLAAVGIYGVLAYSVTQRTRELGIRMALGSTGSRLFGMVIRQGMAVAGIGLVVGLGGALLFVRLLQSLLFGVGSTDPTVLSAVGVLLAGVVLVACLFPARRATRIDPVTALHAE
jgi:predicted permease